MKSAVYEGEVRHSRLAPIRHAFHLPLFMMYLDLDELPSVFERRWLWSSRRPALARYRRGDYFGDPREPLNEAVRERVRAECGVRPAGPIRLLTHLRYWGYVFNPLSMYYCFDPSGTQVEYLLADVTNTPWNERHAYVIPFGEGRAEVDKTFHVSPFLPMDLRYRFFYSEPGETLRIEVATWRGDARLFAAELELERQAITPARLAWVLVRYPALTAQISSAIYWQALRLRWKGAPTYPHESAP